MITRSTTQLFSAKFHYCDRTQLIAESIRSVGPEPTRAKLVALLNAGFQVDTKGVSSPLKYTKDDHRGLVGLRTYNYDFQSKKFKPFGQYADYDKYLK